MQEPETITHPKNEGKEVSSGLTGNYNSVPGAT